MPPGQFYSHGQLERALVVRLTAPRVYVNRNRFSGGDGEEDDSDGDNPVAYARDTLAAVGPLERRAPRAARARLGR